MPIFQDSSEFILIPDSIALWILDVSLDHSLNPVQALLSPSNFELGCRLKKMRKNKQNFFYDSIFRLR
jgi:hypothetical protein